MKNTQAVPKKRLLTSALLLALAPATHAVAQDAEAVADPTELDTIVVTGIRASLTSSMNLKRDAQGIVDGIVAEDIGKFPDTNLAESMQRISGVSIDRSMGEGSKVTVRGVGPDFNLVLLNGRQMPASSIADRRRHRNAARIGRRAPVAISAPRVPSQSISSGARIAPRPSVPTKTLCMTPMTRDSTSSGTDRCSSVIPETSTRIVPIPTMPSRIRAIGGCG